MKLQVAGSDYKDFISAGASFRMDSLSDAFSFVATSTNAVPLPFSGGEACKVIVDGEEVLNGHLEVVNVDGDADNHTITLKGRDRTGDLLDSTIGELSDLKVGGITTLKEVIEAVLKHLKSNLKVTDLAFPDPYLASEDVLAPRSGQNAFDFLYKVARKRQVFIVSTVSGDLAIVRGSGTVVPGAFLQHLVVSPEFQANNILTYTMTYDETGRFRIYKNATQSNPFAWISAGSTVDVDALANNKVGEVEDGEMREGRQYISTGDFTAGSGTTFNKSLWESNIRRARGRTFSCTVSGYRNQSGDLWTPNTLVQVNSDYAGINDSMLISGVQFSLTNDRGRITELTLVEKDAYTLALKEQDPKKGTKSLGLEKIFGSSGSSGGSGSGGSGDE